MRLTKLDDAKMNEVPDWACGVLLIVRDPSDLNGDEAVPGRGRRFPLGLLL